MSAFIGHTEELALLQTLLKKKTASLVVIKGRRRIGKSRLIEEFASHIKHDTFYTIAGLLPSKGTTAQTQRDEFSAQLSNQGPCHYP